MFDPEFYPTPQKVVGQMLKKVSIQWKNILEPSAGKWNIVQEVNIHNPNTVLTYEKSPELAKIVSTISDYKWDDFLQSIPQDLSHIDTVVMNPPFSNAIDHINHAYNVSKKGVEIVALMNWDTYQGWSTKAEQLREKVEKYWDYENLWDCFSDSERKTGVKVVMIYLKKPWIEEEFADFFSDEDDNMQTGDGLMEYDACREIVSRYVATVKTFDKMLDLWVEMQRNTDGIMSGSYGSSDMIFTCNVWEKEVTRESFLKELQKQSWRWIFNKMNLNKFLTEKVYSQLNRKVEEFSSMKFTMKNIYILVDMLIQTQGQRMNDTLVDTFDMITKHYKGNRHAVEGWKTNKSYMVGRKFILEYACNNCKFFDRITSNYHTQGTIQDMMKTFCFTMGYNYDSITSYSDVLDNAEPWVWKDWGMLEVKPYKKGSVHFRFKKKDDWIMFNRKVAEIDGAKLPENIY